MRRCKIKKPSGFIVVLILLSMVYGCQYSEGNRGGASSDALASFALKAISARSGDFEAVDEAFESFNDWDKLEILDIIYVNKTVDEDSRFSQKKSANNEIVFALKEEADRLFGNKFIGDLTDEELSLVYARVAPPLEGSSGGLANRPSCQYHVYHQSVRMNNSVSVGGSRPVAFRRTVDTPNEYPCDYEVTFPVEPRWVGTDFWPTYRLLKSFGGGVIGDQNSVLLGALRTQIWYNTSSESAVNRYFSKTLYAVE